MLSSGWRILQRAFKSHIGTVWAQRSQAFSSPPFWTRPLHMQMVDGAALVCFFPLLIPHSLTIRFRLRDYTPSFSTAGLKCCSAQITPNCFSRFVKHLCRDQSQTMCLRRPCFNGGASFSSTWLDRVSHFRRRRRWWGENIERKW